MTKVKEGKGEANNNDKKELQLGLNKWERKEG
jgi:hypothetical protein